MVRKRILIFYLPKRAVIGYNLCMTEVRNEYAMDIANTGNSRKTMTTLRWTSRDLDVLPENDDKQYEIVDGELYVSKQPHYHHQHLCLRLGGLLDAWSLAT